MRNPKMIKNISAKCMAAIMGAAAVMSPVTAAMGIVIEADAEHYPTWTENGGTITADDTVDVNNGTITENNGTVTQNNGTITENYGTVTNNNSGGSVTVNSGGTVVNNNDGGNVTVNSGGTVTNNNSGGSVTVNSGGTVVNNKSEGSATIYAGGTIGTNNENRIIVNSGGTIGTNNGNGVTVNSGGKIGTNNGDDVTVNNGGAITTNNGAVLNYGSISTNYGDVIGGEGGGSVTNNMRGGTVSGGSVANNYGNASDAAVTNNWSGANVTGNSSVTNNYGGNVGTGIQVTNIYGSNPGPMYTPQSTPSNSSGSDGNIDATGNSLISVADESLTSNGLNGGSITSGGSDLQIAGGTSTFDVSDANGLQNQIMSSLNGQKYGGLISGGATSSMAAVGNDTLTAHVNMGTQVNFTSGMVDVLQSTSNQNIAVALEMQYKGNDMELTIMPGTNLEGVQSYLQQSNQKVAGALCIHSLAPQSELNNRTTNEVHVNNISNADIPAAVNKALANLSVNSGGPQTIHSGGMATATTARIIDGRLQVWNGSEWADYGPIDDVRSGYAESEKSVAAKKLEELGLRIDEYGQIVNNSLSSVSSNNGKSQAANTQITSGGTQTIYNASVAVNGGGSISPASQYQVQPAGFELASGGTATNNTVSAGDTVNLGGVLALGSGGLTLL